MKAPIPMNINMTASPSIPYIISSLVLRYRGVPIAPPLLNVLGHPIDSVTLHSVNLVMIHFEGDIQLVPPIPSRVPYGAP